MKSDNTDPETRDDDAASASGHRDWLPKFPPTPGDLCAKALIWLGWIPIAWSRDICALMRGEKRIFVPRAIVLDHKSIDRLLRRAAVTPLEFIEALEAVCEQDIQDLSARNPRG